jgi:hypothetical protein
MRVATGAPPQALAFVSKRLLQRYPRYQKWLRKFGHWDKEE